MKYLLICLLWFPFLVGCTHVTSSPWKSCFEGLSNNGKNGNKIYVTAGRKAQIIGLQNATFPDMGNHVVGEMGGIWTGSFKLSDGFWMNLSDVDSGEDSLLCAKEMIVFPHKNKFDFGTPIEDIQITATQFASDIEPGIVVSYTLENLAEKECMLNLDFLLNTDLSPVWFSTENGIFNGVDEVKWDAQRKMFLAKDSLNDWYMAWGCGNDIISSYEIGRYTVYTQGKIVPTKLRAVLSLQPGQKEHVRYAIASSIHSFDDAIANCLSLLKNSVSEVEEKKSSIASLLSSAEIDIPDKDLERAYYWTLINSRWLETDIDTIGLFLTAGAMEYPWLFGCDNSYALQGVLRTGRFDLVESTLNLLDKMSDKVNGDGRIIHEMSSNGFVGNKGNTQETAHYIVAVWETFKWTGNKRWLESLYPHIKKSIKWLTETMDSNNNGFPEGYGIMEVKGLNAELIDVSVYTCQALQAVSDMASLFGEVDLSVKYSKEARLLKEKINTFFWDEEANSYCDFYGSRDDAIDALKGAIGQAIALGSASSERAISYYTYLLNDISEKYSENAFKGWLTNKNWVVNTPMECGLAPYKRGRMVLENVYSHDIGKYGPYLSAVDRQRMMTISTGVQAVAEARYNRIDKSIEYLQMMASALNMNMPGAINEMLPDYGCPFQAWTIYGMSVALISGCFGIEPQAYFKEVIIAPQLPSEWTQMSIRNLRIGDNRLSLQIKVNEGKYYLKYKFEQDGWTVKLRLPFENRELVVDGNVQSCENDFLELKNQEHTIMIL